LSRRSNQNGGQKTQGDSVATFIITVHGHLVDESRSVLSREFEKYSALKGNTA